MYCSGYLLVRDLVRRPLLCCMFVGCFPVFAVTAFFCLLSSDSKICVPIEKHRYLLFKWIFRFLFNHDVGFVAVGLVLRVHFLG